MTDYWDYLKDSFKYPLSTGPAAFLHALYNQQYDNSHGSKRYYLSKLKPFSTVRNIRDSARKAQDRWNATHRDEEYIDRVGGTDIGSAILGDVAGGAATVGMARSLAHVYKAEVEEDVGNPRRPQNIMKGIM